MQVLTNKQDSHLAFARLKRELERETKRHQRHVGWQGGNRNLSIRWSSKHHFWSHLNATVDAGRYWCCFGTELGPESRSHSITVELNPPKGGIQRRTAGLFLRDKGQVLVGHSGKIGGGRKGIGKGAFLDWYDGTVTEAEWPDGRRATVFPIGRLGSRELPSQMARFIRSVESFKAGALQPTTVTGGSGDPRVSYTPEFTGTVTRKGQRPIDVHCSHGHVVDALAKLIGRQLLVGNDQSRDLFGVLKTGEVRALFEVKTSVTSTSVYAGVGQLMVHGASGGDAPLRCLVLPGRPKGRIRVALQTLGIIVLTYDLDAGRVQFHNADQVLAKLR